MKGGWNIMKFDIIIIGGGLSGLTAGIALAQAGKEVAVVSAGQSSLHFGSGSLDLLGCDQQGNEVTNPIEAIASLNDEHPYKKVKDIEAIALQAKQLLNEAGIATTGNASVNHWRLTPIGALKPTWLTVNGMATVPSPKEMPWKRVALVNIINYLDFPTKFIAAGLRNKGVEVDVKAFTIPELQQLRKSPSEMRSTNIAKVIESNDIVGKIAGEVNNIAGDGYDMVLLPAVLGIANDNISQRLLKLINVPASYVATLPPSVTGVRIQTLLRKRFTALGGTFFTGDQVVEGVFEDNNLKGVRTAKLEDTVLEASHFILATGSFMSRGLVADYYHVYEPALGVDVEDHDLNRKNWAVLDVANDQPYMEIGVKTDDMLHCMRQGKTISNLFAAGSILSGHNSIKRLDAAGVDMLTALQTVNNILQ